LGGDVAALLIDELGMARVDFCFGRGDELIEQVVGFYAETLAAADFDERPRLILFA
jgi:hypothetical protein